MTPQTITTAGEPLAAALTDTEASALLHLALHAPAGLTAPAAAAALARPQGWVYRHLNAGIADGTITRLGPDLRTRADRYRATHPAVTPTALLAGALLVLTDQGWTTEDRAGEDGTGPVDLLGAIRLAADVHPYDMPDDHQAQAAVLAAEDELALGLGGDPTQVDAGDLIAIWQDTPGVGAAAVTDLVLTTLQPLTVPAPGELA